MLYVADFCPGWSPEVPYFFLRDLPAILTQYRLNQSQSHKEPLANQETNHHHNNHNNQNNMLMYEIDIHPMRTRNLHYKLLG